MSESLHRVRRKKNWLRVAGLGMTGLLWALMPGMDPTLQVQAGGSSSLLVAVASFQDEPMTEPEAATESAEPATQDTSAETAASSSTDDASGSAAGSSEAGPPDSGDSSRPAAGGETGAPAAGLYEQGSELFYTINTLIMFICAVLVIFMQAGFAMVEAGLNSSKNTVNILFKNLMDLAVGVLLFWLIGFNLMYPGDAGAGKWFATPALFAGRGTFGDEVDCSAEYAPSADFLFQVAFAATAATIVSGAVAGRMKFVGYLVYSAVITAFIYPVSGMWKWGGGALQEMGFADFAGSVVVHAVGGFAGLAGAIALGPRIGRYSPDGKSVPIPGHNLTFAALGVFILWVGWYGFNPGSQLTYAGAANAEVTVYIGVTTTLAAAAGCVVATIISWILFKKPDLTMALNGALAGLVGITANCDQVTHSSALVIGAVAGLLVILGIILLDKLKIDDPVGAFPVHGLCGVWGGLATGIFGMNLPTVDEVTVSQFGYFLIQLKATVIICAWAFVTMFALFMVLKVAGLLRVSEEEELQGLDVCEHGQHAYN